MDKIQKNVLGEDLENCSNNPLTGWFRDGCCNTDKNDRGVHTVCAKVTDEFLQWSKKVGNDLTDTRLKLKRNPQQPVGAFWIKTIVGSNPDPSWKEYLISA